MTCCLEGSCSIQLSYRSGYLSAFFEPMTFPTLVGILYLIELPVLIFYIFEPMTFPTLVGMLFLIELPVHICNSKTPRTSWGSAKIVFFQKFPCPNRTISRGLYP